MASTKEEEVIKSNKMRKEEKPRKWKEVSWGKKDIAKNKTENTGLKYSLDPEHSKIVPAENWKPVM